MNVETNWENRMDGRLSRVAVLVALACVLQVAESFIPHPVPGLRLGLANMITLTAMVLLGFRYAMEVALLRTILSALIMGTFMSPTFILSFSGAVVSTAVMGLFYWLSGIHRYFRLSVIGVSILGAVTHNMVQLFLAYFLLVKHGGIFIFFPYLSLGAVATGWVVGVVTGGVCCRVLNGDTNGTVEKPAGYENPWLNRHYQPGTSFFHRLPASLKLSVTFLLSVYVFVIDSLYAYLIIFLIMMFLAAVSRVAIKAIFLQMKRFAMLPLTAFLLPVFFHSSPNIIAQIGVLKITAGGVHLGTLFALRILLLLFASGLLVRTTSLEEMTRGLSQVLFPIEFLGISRHRVATVLTLAWEAVPGAWEAARSSIATAEFKKVHTLRNLIPHLSRLIAALYLRAGQVEVQKKETVSKKVEGPMETA